MPGRASDSSNRSLLASAATAAALGIAFSVAGSRSLGAWLTVAALVALVYSLHRFGRSGPDAPIGFEPADAPEE